MIHSDQAAENRERRAKNNRPVLVTLLSFITPCLLLFSPVQAEKNVLLLMADDLNDWIGVLGGHPQVKTPNMDKFAKKAVLFRNAHCSAPVCLPSRTSMLTGMRPTTSGYYGNSDGYFRNNPKYANIVTLPQFFKNKGYYTATAGKIFHKSSDMGVPEDTVSWNFHTWRNACKESPNPFPYAAIGFGNPGYSADTTAEMTDEWYASTLISSYLKKPMTQNFFLGYGGSKPHSPWHVPKKFFDMYPPSTLIMPEYLLDDLSDVPRPNYSTRQLEAVLAAKSYPIAVQGYLACVTFADYCMGQLLDVLDTCRYRDSTIVLIMGDHGWHNGEKLHFGKVTNWEEGTRTTFMMYDPSIAKPGIVDQAVSLQDVYPTLMDLTGNTPPSQVEGRSLRPILENPQKNSFIGWALVNFRSGTAHTLRTDKWSLIRYSDKAPVIDYELYNMFTDPLQHTNLAKKAEYADIIAKLSADIDRIIKGEAPVNTDIYGTAPSIAIRTPGSRDKALALAAHKIYRLKAYGVNGKLVREFTGKGPDIERMIAIGEKGLGLPMGKYVYRVFDIQNNLVQTISSSWQVR